MARQKHVRDESLAREIRTLSGFGIPVKKIASLKKIGLDTIYKHYGTELEEGQTIANTNVVKALYKKATEDNDVTAQIFWCKTRLGWRETKHIDHTSSDNSLETKQVNINVKDLDPKEVAKMTRAIYRGECDEENEKRKDEGEH